jgi:hypothetical protein
VIRNMKIIIALVIGMLISIALVIVPWAIDFIGPLPDDPQHWAQFGDYVGGTLSSLIAALGLVALIYTLRQQQEQINQLRKQAAKEDLLKAIEKLEDDFYKSLTRYPIKMHWSGKTMEFSGIDVVFSPSFIEYKEVLITTDEILDLINKAGDVKATGGFERDDPKILALEMFNFAAGHLNQIRLYANKLDEMSGNNVLSKYYQRKYSIPYQRFLERGILKESWGEKHQ